MNSKKQKITNAAYKLFINQGYNSSSIQDILDEAGVSKGTFYNYFSSKTECLIAIMESVGSEIRQKRIAASVGRPLDDLDVLAEQMYIRIQMNREKNLFALYESIFYSQDEELKKYAREVYITELNWIATRITDVFGDEAKPFALDNAAAVHGSIQQLINLWKVTSTEELPTKALSSFVLRRLKTNIADQIKQNDRFIQKNNLTVSSPLPKMTLPELSGKLKDLVCQEDEPDARELVIFLADELIAKEPRYVLMESALATLSNSHTYELELVAALEKVWNILQERKKEAKR
ncbi:putative HTH-type transcriptional regulator YvdT [Planococcus massiliensis]|uniref:Putative HTH-type transcriptional regulator YvdT n=1 Tax=Planococcus massiliensis TaxID=1499687 RepID=A0A098EP58_9BACL|nr:TetR/AcrR family transcriptional regulator [Planococcus massiliensis]CEG23590.1 putative HTH-type transcriptional regulator YvdT [Planococcus massiliensis]